MLLPIDSYSNVSLSSNLSPNFFLIIGTRQNIRTRFHDFVLNLGYTLEFCQIQSKCEVIVDEKMIGELFDGESAYFCF